MEKQPHVVVTKSRDVRTYAELWHASDCLLALGQEDQRASTWKFLASTMLTAFAFEAYLNHVGQTLFAAWAHFDRLPPWGKLELLCDKLNVVFPAGAGARPMQTVGELLSFRNTIAHGRSVIVEEGPLIRTVDNYTRALGEDALTNWENLIQDDRFAVRAREDVSAVLERIHAARPDPKEALFTFGLGQRGATLVLDP